MTARLVPLTEELLHWAVAEEQDPLTATLAKYPGWHLPFVAPTAIGAALIGDGRVLAAGGLLPQWHGRAIAWIMISPRANGRHKSLALREVRRSMLSAQRYPEWRRIEMYVRDDEPWGIRFARFLDMRLEGLMRAFDSYGRDYKLFARVAPETD